MVCPNFTHGHELKEGRDSAETLGAVMLKEHASVKPITMKENPHVMAQRQLADCARLLNLDDAAHSMLREPMRELHVSIPVKMDDGKMKVFRGFRVQHNDA